MLNELSDVIIILSKKTHVSVLPKIKQTKNSGEDKLTLFYPKCAIGLMQLQCTLLFIPLGFGAVIFVGKNKKKQLWSKQKVFPAMILKRD